MKKKSIKSNDVMKHRDRASMLTFSCGSLLKIRLQVISGILTAKIHLCKHLVQSVDVTPGFFTELTRRRTMPIYEHTELGNSISDAKGSVSAGDDFVWMGRRGDLSSGKWRSIIGPGASSGIASTSRRLRLPLLVEYEPSQNKRASFSLLCQKLIY